MSSLRTAISLAGWGALGGTVSYTIWTRGSKVHPLPQSDYIFSNTLYARYNPNNAPVSQDICVRQVPISKIRPELLEKEGALVERFCAGVWSGKGYSYQRWYLQRKYRGPDTASQLWDRADLASSSYDVGTQITDHFEVVSKTPTSIIVRCGDSPRNLEVREADGLFEMLADVKEAEGVVEFGLKSVFYNGLAQPDKEGKPPNAPMSSFVQWLHQHYDKVLMETAIKNCMK